LDILVVEARYHPAVSDALVDGATKALQLGGARFTRVSVPGVLEVPAAIAMGARAKRFQGYVALGSLLLAGGPQIGIMTQSCFFGLMRLSADQGLSIGNGIVVAQTEAEALRMALKEEGDQGGDAARACLSLVTLATRVAPPS